MNNKRIIYWLPVIVLFFLVFIYQIQVERWYLVDSYEYIYGAQSFTEDGSWYSKDKAEAYDPAHHTRRTPLYPILLVMSNWFTDAPWFVALWQIGLSLLNIFILTKILNLLRLPRIVRPILIPFLLLMPALYIYANLVMTEVIFQTLLMGMVYFMLMALKFKEQQGVILVMALLILSFLTKPVMYLFVLPFLLISTFLAWKWKRWLLILIGVAPLFVVSAYQFHNLEKTGYFHFSSVQNLNLLQLTTYNLLINRVGEEEAISITDDIYEKARANESFAEGFKYMQSACLSIMWEHKWYYIGYHLKGMVNFFLDPGRFDLYHLLGKQTVGDSAGLSRAFGEGGYAGLFRYLSQQPIGLLLFLGLVFLANVIKLVGFVGFLLMKKIPIEVRLTFFTLIGYLAFVTGPYGASRFAMPVSLLVLGAAAIFYGTIWSERAPSRPLLAPK
ncbi:MAG: hypothetical protein AAFY71_13170 [Bacteroidota bacterium]